MQILQGDAVRKLSKQNYENIDLNFQFSRAIFGGKFEFQLYFWICLKVEEDCLSFGILLSENIGG